MRVLSPQKRLDVRVGISGHKSQHLASQITLRAIDPKASKSDFTPQLLSAAMAECHYCDACCVSCVCIYIYTYRVVIIMTTMESKAQRACVLLCCPCSDAPGVKLSHLVPCQLRFISTERTSRGRNERVHKNPKWQRNHRLCLSHKTLILFQKYREYCKAPAHSINIKQAGPTPHEIRIRS